MDSSCVCLSERLENYDFSRAYNVMKDRSKKMCGHGVSVINQRSEDCSLHIVCDFLFYYRYPCTEREHDASWNLAYKIYMCPASLKCTSLKLP